MKFFETEHFTSNIYEKTDILQQKDKEIHAWVTSQKAKAASFDKK